MMHFFFCLSQLSEILKFGLDKLLSSEGSNVQEVDLENILGETKEGAWITDMVLPSKEENEEQDMGSMFSDLKVPGTPSSLVTVRESIKEMQ